MATKEKLKTKAARVREEARETGKVILRAPALVRVAECVIRFLLGTMLSGFSALYNFIWLHIVIKHCHFQLISFFFQLFHNLPHSRARYLELFAYLLP